MASGSTVISAKFAPTRALRKRCHMVHQRRAGHIHRVSAVSSNGPRTRKNALAIGPSSKQIVQFACACVLSTATTRSASRAYSSHSQPVRSGGWCTGSFDVAAPLHACSHGRGGPVVQNLDAGAQKYPAGLPTPAQPRPVPPTRSARKRREVSAVA